MNLTGQKPILKIMSRDGSDKEDKVSQQAQ